MKKTPAKVPVLPKQKGHAKRALKKQIKYSAKLRRERAQVSRAVSLTMKLGAGALAEARHGLRFGVVHIEHRQQLGDLQHFLELAAQVAETQRRALALCAVMRRHQRAQARAV